MSQAKDQDQSMEEILQSIKRIIAEEGTPATGGSDVLELTDMITEDFAIPPGMEPPATTTLGTMSIDEIMAAPISASSVYEPEPAPQPVPAPAPVFEPTPVAPAPTPAPAPVPPVAVAPATDDGLLSDTTLRSASAALDALKNIPEAPIMPFIASGVGFRSGATIEDLVLEALKPMLKEWLDANLTGIVTTLVEKEVRKLSHR